MLAIGTAWWSSCLSPSPSSCLGGWGGGGGVSPLVAVGKSTGGGGGSPFHYIYVPLSFAHHLDLLCCALRLIDTIIMLTFQSRKLKFREGVCFVQSFLPSR